MQRGGKLSFGKWQNWYSNPGLHDHKPGFIFPCHYLLVPERSFGHQTEKTFWTSLGIYVNLVQKLHSVFPLYVSSASCLQRLYTHDGICIDALSAWITNSLTVILWCNMTETDSAPTTGHLFRACLLFVFSNSFQSMKLWRKTKLPGSRPQFY